jgi:hypothetical protein
MIERSCKASRRRLLWPPLRTAVVAVIVALNAAFETPWAEAAQELTPNLTTNIDRPLRYRPDGADFVIENGNESFNRPLYGGNTAFRVDGGDRPEFVLYLPGRGGNLRLGLIAGGRMLWTHNAARITTRYRPGELLYEIRDPIIGSSGVIRLAAIASNQIEGLVVRIEAASVPADLELVWAYGGVTGQRGRRDGDIGTEDVPISQWFALKPEFCRENVFELKAEGFSVKARTFEVDSIVPGVSQSAFSDAVHWNDLGALVANSSSEPPPTPVIIGRTRLINEQPRFLSLSRRSPGVTAAVNIDAARLPHLFDEAETHFASLRTRVRVETPDAFLNAAVGALNVAADAVWDEPQKGIMHGAIAWRSRLLGWRGPYAFDALAWPERSRAHFEYWASRQNLGPIPPSLPPPDSNANLARSEQALHSNGDMSNSHYDMNAVYIDALFRHLLWTGELEFAKKMWPTIERHLAWERRLFRREYGPEKLPLYEAYAMIWASDDLQYSGGGTAHASAYNYWHNTMAARLAPLVGADPFPYVAEAALIARGMRELLWMKDRGMFAEAKDWLGSQLIHPSAALWSFYVTLDSGVPTPAEAWSMTGYVDTQIPQLPVRGPGVPPSLHTLASSNWMPYTWSINNVVMGEAVHAALGYWQAGRPDDAWRITKASLTAAMYMGISPGNVGSMSYLDVYRRESQRDFADGSGVLSRALIEGLFGVRPDAIKGELLIAPGFPSEWDHASLTHPRVGLTFLRKGRLDSFTVEPRFGKPMSLRLQLPAGGDKAQITINGGAVTGRIVEGPRPLREIIAPAAPKYDIRVVWSGATPPGARIVTIARETEPSPPPRGFVAADGPQETIDLTPHFNDRVTAIFRPGKYLKPRSPFVSLALPSQGLGYWAGHVNATAEIDDSGLRRRAGTAGEVKLESGLRFRTPGEGNANNIVFTSQWDNYPRSVELPLAGRGKRLHLLMAGSTNAMQSRLDNGEVVVTYEDGSTETLTLRNPETWWPIEQDYFIDDYQFRFNGPLPIRVDLKSGSERALDARTFKGRGRTVPGGAATVFGLSLNPAKTLRSLTVRALANDVVIGLMAATLER